ncbi:MAG: arylsulfatase [Pirellulaceae bacterium]|nr:arylsulfatase [Pirellulaceae bacterium]
MTLSRCFPVTISIGLLGLVLTPLLAQAADKPARPNVIVILSDDQGYGDFSRHGNPVLKTPNLDKLAIESVRLTDFHVAPMCTPTRGQLLTGLDACRSGATSVSAGRSFIRPGVPTMPEIFAQSGYQTAIFGKWHLGDSYPNLPHQRGFGEAVYHLGWGITSMADTWQNDNFDGRFFHNGVLQPYPGYCTDVWFNLTIDWIKQRQAAGEPFFVYLPTNAPHGPHWVPAKYKALYENSGGPAAFFGMLANLDENMGRLDEFLKSSGLAENTIVIYFHDNGGTAGVKLFNAGMRGMKTTYYEGGHRAACFVRWPAGKLGEPRDVDELCQVQDLLPTLIDLCGLKGPGAERFDGLSLAPALRGQVKRSSDRMLVVQYGQKPEKFDSAVLWHKWRLVKGTELYDLRSDPGQLTDVSAANLEVLQKMRAHYENWWTKVEPLLADPVPIVLGADEANPVTLTAADWWNVYCDNMQNLRAGKETNSVWNVQIAQDGEYEFALRRWPREADAAIAAGVPAFQAVDGMLPAGKALPIASIRLKVGEHLDQTKIVADAKEVKFTVKLKAGEKFPLQSFCLDAAGKELCGAYFCYVTRK